MSVRIGCEDHAAMRRDVAGARSPCSAMSKSAGMPPLPPTPRRNGTARNVPFRVIGPLVIRADEFLGTLPLSSRQNSAARWAATILDHVDRAVLVARDDHGVGPTLERMKSPGVGDLGFQRDVIPGAAVEDALDLALVDGFVGVDPVGHALQALGGPE